MKRTRVSRMVEPQSAPASAAAVLPVPWQVGDICFGQPLNDAVGRPCSKCRHTPHPWSECRECMLDIKLAQAQDAIDGLRRATESIPVLVDLAVRARLAGGNG